MTAAALLQAKVDELARALQAQMPVEVVKTTPYWSVARVAATRSGTDPNFTYTVPAGTEVKFFTYAIGQNMSSAGYVTKTATLADTNLQTASQTIDGDTVDIIGIGIQALPSTDVKLLEQGAQRISIKCSLNGGNNAQVLGPLVMLGGGNNVFGSAASPAMQGAVISFASIGWPVGDNALTLPERIIWQPAGKVDSTLAIVARVEEEISFLSGANASLPDPPATIELAMLCRLYNVAHSNRSVNA